MPSSPITRIRRQLEDLPRDLAQHIEAQSIAEVLALFPDPRKPRGVRHALAWILATTLCAVLAGSKSFAAIADWALHAADTSLHGTGFRAPHVTTYQRVLGSLDADAFDQAVGTWVRTRIDAQVIAIDGKEVRGAKHAGGTRVHLMAAVDHNTGAVLGQVEVGGKTNEITQFETLLETLGDLQGRIFTADALHTQRAHAEFLHQQGAHFVLTVKANQPKLLKHLTALPWELAPVGNDQRDTGHGRRAIRRIKVSSVPKGLGFPHVAQVAQLIRKTKKRGTNTWSIETVYIITSVPVHRGSPKQLNTWVRGHWGIENGLHWRRDSIYLEDKSQVRTGSAPRVMASMRSLAISVLLLAGTKNVAQGNRKMSFNPARPMKTIGMTGLSTTLH